jgi:hypothetical protein
MMATFAGPSTLLPFLSSNPLEEDHCDAIGIEGLIFDIVNRCSVGSVVRVSNSCWKSFLVCCGIIYPDGVRAVHTA